MEPSLSRARIVGAVHAEVDRFVQPQSLTDGLAAWLRANGVEIREGVSVDEIVAEGGGVRVRTADAWERVERVVLAAGAGSAGLLSSLGVKVPLVGARGYSLTTADSGTRPRHALYLAEAKVGISSYDDSVRVAGVFELGRRARRPRPQALRRHARVLRAVLRRLEPGRRAAAPGVGGAAAR